uniref:FYVE-type domain-containing protein n=1 Tax=Plectus sambesii TaxID=2011161 RepID=A0A914VE22_9BILA
MAATINTRPSSSAASSHQGTLTDTDRPTLLTKLEPQPARVNAAVLLSREDGMITVSDDRSVRVYLKRDSGQYWPSICQFLPAAAIALDYNEPTARLFVGLSNGTVYEFTIAEDFNSLKETRQMIAHMNGISCVRFSLQCELVFSCGKDKALVWHCSETGNRMGSYLCEAWCTALELDSATKYAFVGDYSGNVLVIHILGDNAQLVSKLSAHTGSIRSLAWDHQRQLLFSGSNDNLVIMWDIGGRRGQAFELNGHKTKLSCLAYILGKKRLFSADESGSLMCWDMAAHRLETPAWQSSDACQRCESPFFWNLRAMWDKKVVGLRQHHCRMCGQAVCASCCSHLTKYPPMGYELPVRICDGCHRDMQADSDRFDMTPLALAIDLRQSIVCMSLDETKGRLLTVGNDRVLMLWDVKRLAC